MVIKRQYLHGQGFRTSGSVLRQTVILTPAISTLSAVDRTCSERSKMYLGKGDWKPPCGLPVSLAGFAKVLDQHIYNLVWSFCKAEAGRPTCKSDGSPKREPRKPKFWISPGCVHGCLCLVLKEQLRKDLFKRHGNTEHKFLISGLRSTPSKVKEPQIKERAVHNPAFRV